MTLKEHTITGSAEAVLTLDGQGIAFTLMEGHTPLLRVKFKLDDMPAFIHHLCWLVGEVHPATRPSAPTHVIAASDITIAQATDTTGVVVAMQIPGMNIAYQLETHQATQLADVLARVQSQVESALGRPRH